MAQKITLHRASRVAESVKTAISQTHVPTVAAVSIYSKDVEADMDRARREFEAGMERQRKLTDALAAIRGAVGAENARCGINEHLARKNAIDQRLGQIKQVVGEGSKPVQTRGAVPMEEARERISSYRSRAESADGVYVEEEVRVNLVGDDEREALERERIALRRELEEISDKLRELNGTRTIEISDDIWSYLQEQRVI